MEEEDAEMSDAGGEDPDRRADPLLPGDPGPNKEERERQRRTWFAARGLPLVPPPIEEVAPGPSVHPSADGEPHFGHMIGRAIDGKVQVAGAETGVGLRALIEAAACTI